MMLLLEIENLNFLKRIWNESWSSIKEKLEAEGSTWYVWWMDGVNTLEIKMRKRR